jgi:hypothetical protein
MWQELQQVYSVTRYVDVLRVRGVLTATKQPAIIGTNTNEGAALLPYSANGPSVAAMKAATNAAFACPAVSMTKYVPS